MQRSFGTRVRGWTRAYQFALLHEFSGSAIREVRGQKLMRRRPSDILLRRWFVGTLPRLRACVRDKASTLNSAARLADCMSEFV